MHYFARNFLRTENVLRVNTIFIRAVVRAKTCNIVLLMYGMMLEVSGITIILMVWN